MNYIPNSNFLTIKIVNTPSSVLQFYYFIDSGSTNSQDRGGCRELMTMIRRFSLNVRKFFMRPLQTLKTVINWKKSVHEIQNYPCVISKFDALCYSIEPKPNKKISLNLLKYIKLLFKKVRAFSFARDVKERFMARTRN